jgi:hypothetical protein
MLSMLRSNGAVTRSGKIGAAKAVPTALLSAKRKNFLTQERDFRNNSFDARILGHQITGKSALTTQYPPSTASLRLPSVLKFWRRNNREQ